MCRTVGRNKGMKTGGFTGFDQHRLQPMDGE